MPEHGYMGAFEKEFANRSSRKKVHVCILVDYRAALELARDRLTQAGFSAVGTADLGEAFQEVYSGNCGVILVDLASSAMDGSTFMRKCLASAPGLYVILISNSYCVDSAIGAIKDGAYDYLGKPVDFPRLERTLDELARVFSERDERHASAEAAWASNALEFQGSGAANGDAPGPISQLRTTREPSIGASAPKPLEEVRRLHIQHVLATCNGNRVRAAQMLGIGRTSLYRFLKREEKSLSAGRHRV